METCNSIKGEHLLYECDNIKHKHYYAGLLNMAQLNFSIALKEVLDRTEKSIYKNYTIDWAIDKTFNANITQSDWNYRIEILSEFLPVVKALKPNEKDAFIAILHLFNKTLDDLRNYYTHHYHSNIKIDEKLFTLLDNLLLTSIINVKKQRLKTNQNKVLLPKQFENDYINFKTKLTCKNAEYQKKYLIESQFPKNMNKTKSKFDKEFNIKNHCCPR